VPLLPLRGGNSVRGETASSRKERIKMRKDDVKISDQMVNQFSYTCLHALDYCMHCPHAIVQGCAERRIIGAVVASDETPVLIALTDFLSLNSFYVCYCSTPQVTVPKVFSIKGSFDQDVLVMKLIAAIMHLLINI
jgi:hypothetical protein